MCIRLFLSMALYGNSPVFSPKTQNPQHHQSVRDNLIRALTGTTGLILVPFLWCGAVNVNFINTLAHLCGFVKFEQTDRKARYFALVAQPEAKVFFDSFGPRRLAESM